MTPERIARLVTWWVRRYTRDLPPSVAERRAGEIDADLHDHITDARTRGEDDRRLALAIAARMLRGLPADAAWRRRASARSRPEEMPMYRRSALRVALVTAAVLTPLLLLSLVTDGMNWGLGDFVLAAGLLIVTGFLLELAVRHQSNIVLRAAAAAVGLAAIASGEADDAPGLVGFGFLLVLATVALTIRTARRST